MSVSCQRELKCRNLNQVGFLLVSSFSWSQIICLSLYFIIQFLCFESMIVSSFVHFKSDMREGSTFSCSSKSFASAGTLTIYSTGCNK